MSLFDNKLHHESQAHAALVASADLLRALDAGQPVQHVAEYYRRRWRAHFAAWFVLAIAEKGES